MAVADELKKPQPAAAGAPQITPPPPPAITAVQAAANSPTGVPNAGPQMPIVSSQVGPSPLGMRPTGPNAGPQMPIVSSQVGPSPVGVRSSVPNAGPQMPIVSSQVGPSPVGVRSSVPNAGPQMPIVSSQVGPPPVGMRPTGPNAGPQMPIVSSQVGPSPLGMRPVPPNAGPQPLPNVGPVQPVGPSPVGVRPVPPNAGPQPLPNVGPVQPVGPSPVGVRPVPPNAGPQISTSQLAANNFNAANRSIGMPAVGGPIANVAGGVVRGAAKAAPWVAGAVDAGKVLDVATDPNKTAVDTIEQGGRTATKWAAGTAGALKGAAWGAAAGSAVPVVGTAVGGAAGGLIGGALGYFGAEKALNAMGSKEQSDTSYGAVKQGLGMQDPNAPVAVVAPAAPAAPRPPLEGPPTAANAGPNKANDFYIAEFPDSAYPQPPAAPAAPTGPVIGSKGGKPMYGAPEVAGPDPLTQPGSTNDNLRQIANIRALNDMTPMGGAAILPDQNEAINAERTQRWALQDMLSGISRSGTPAEQSARGQLVNTMASGKNQMDVEGVRQGGANTRQLIQNAVTERGQNINQQLGMVQADTARRGQTLQNQLGLGQLAETARGHDLTSLVQMRGQDKQVDIHGATNKTQRDINADKIASDEKIAHGRNTTMTAIEAERANTARTAARLRVAPPPGAAMDPQTEQIFVLKKGPNGEMVRVPLTYQ